MECSQCGRCCKYIVFQIPSSIDKDLKEYYEVRGFVVLPAQHILLQYNPCPYLKDNKCSIHDKKPELCRRLDAKHLDGVLILKGCAYEKYAHPYQILELPESIRKV